MSRSRSRRRALALAVVLLAVGGAARAEEDARAIIEQAFEAAKLNEARAREYVFHERLEERRFNRRGEETRRESKTWDVTLFETSEYRQLIAKNDRPLDSQAAAREQRKLDRQIRKAVAETPRQKEQRLAKVEKERREGEEFLEEITRAFDFRVLRREEVRGVPTWVISAEPREGYRPPNRRARALTKVRATLWVSRRDHGWVQAEIETFDDINWAGIYKLREGAQVRFRQRLLDDEVWITEEFNVRLRARIAFVYRLDAEFNGRYSNFRRFSADTTVTGWTRAD